jgi:hypothetical protein
MPIKPLYDFDDATRQRIIKEHLQMQRGGEVTDRLKGHTAKFIRSC